MTPAPLTKINSWFKKRKFEAALEKEFDREWEALERKRKDCQEELNR
jgi:hypothetical protein